MPGLIFGILSVIGKIFSFGALAGPAAATFGAAVLSQGVQLGLSIVSRLRQGQSDTDGAEAVRQTIRKGITPQRWVLGRRMIGGQLIYPGVRNEGSNQVARFAFSLCNGPSDALEAVRVRGDLVRLVKQSGSALHLPVSSSPYRGKLEVYFYAKADGTEGSEMRTEPAFPAGSEFSTSDTGPWGSTFDAQTNFYRYANPNYDPNSEDEQNRMQMFVDNFATDLPTWTVAHKVNGKTWAYVRYIHPEYDDVKDRFWTSWPSPEFLVRGLKITWPGQDTPTWTRNAAAIYYWWLTVRRGFAADRIDTTAFRSAFTLCEEDVAVELPQRYIDQGFNATSKRYAVDAVIESGQDVERIEEDLDAAMAGGVAEKNGLLQIRPGRDYTSSFTLDDSWLAKDAIPVVNSVRPLQERVNAIDCEILQSSQHEWTRFSVGRFTDSDSEERDGQTRANRIVLSYVADPIAAARIQAILLRRNRESRTVTARFRPGDQYELLENIAPGDVVTWGSAAYGLAADTYNVILVRYHLSGEVTLNLSQEIAGTFDDTLVLPELKPVNIARPPDPRSVFLSEPSALAVAEAYEVQDDGAVIVEMVATWTNTGSPNTQIQWQSRRDNPDYDPTDTSSQQYIYSDWTAAVSVQGTRAEITVPGIQGTVWRVRARHTYEDTQASRWAFAEAAVTRDVRPPGPITNLNASGIPSGLAITWTNPSDADFALAEITVTKGTDSSVTTVAADYVAIAPLEPETEYAITALAIDMSGNRSAPTAAITATSGAAAGEGARGPRGEDGAGREITYCLSPDFNEDGTDFSFRDDEKPVLAWTFHQTRVPVRRGRVTWTFPQPSTTPELPKVWGSDRPISGSPQEGDPV